MAYNFPPNPSLNEIYTSNGRTFKWNGVQWVAVVAPTSSSAPVFVSSSQPSNPVNGALWFNTIDQTLYVRVSSPNGSYWAESYPGANPAPAVNPCVTVSTSEPANAREGDLWFNPVSDALKVRVNSLSGGTWELAGGYTPAPPVKVEVSSTPPVDPEQGVLWFNSTDGNLYVWRDSLEGGFWDSVESSSTPSPPVLVSVSEPNDVPLGYLWFNPSNGSLKVKALLSSGPGWETVAGGSSPAPQFAKVRVSASPPLNPESGALWFNSSDSTLYVWVASDGGGFWNIANDAPEPVNSPTIRISSFPPANPVPGDLWYDPDDSNLSIWYEDLDSSQWVAVVPYPQTFLPIQGGVLEGPIYANYPIPDDQNAFVTVGWVEGYLDQRDIPKSILTEKGSIISASAEGVPVEVKPGQNGEFLKVDYASQAGIAWSNNVDCGAF